MPAQLSVRQLTALAVAVALVIALTACGSTAAKEGPPTTAEIRIGPMTPTDPNRMTPEDAAAILQLGRSTAGPPAGGHGHGSDAVAVSVPLFTGDALTFADQWRAAVTSVSRYDTIEKAAALGFVRTAAPAAGVGTHWIKWSWVAQPFDAAKPSMLLFDERTNPPQLVGYSYLLQSAARPEGFAGDLDTWHQHTGLCVVNGWVDREESAGPLACAGTFLAGGDIWMLHAWVVPRWSNRHGQFANENPRLCPSALTTPDVLRCGGSSA